MNTMNDVKTDEAVPAQSQEQEQPTTDVSEDVKTPEVEGQVDRDVYVKVREAMKAEREAKKAEKARNAELEARIAQLEQTPQPTKPSGVNDKSTVKADLLYEMYKDPFLKENLDLVEAKMTDNPNMDVSQASTAVKAEFFDRIQKESTPVLNTKLKQAKPTAKGEPIKQELKGDDLYKAALEGKVNIDPMQLQAIQAQRPTQRR